MSINFRRRDSRLSTRSPRKLARRLRIETLESRIALHAGHDHDLDPTPEPEEGHDHGANQTSWLAHLIEDNAAFDAAVVAGMPQPDQLLAAAVPGANQGQWGPLQAWPIEAINAVLLPTGKVLGWDRTFNLRLWDPTTNTFTQPSDPGYNIFCSGTALLADGSLLVTGGHVVDSIGVPFAAIYDPFNDTWTQQAPMDAGRWYPSSTTLANGDVLVLSGDVQPGLTDPLPQVYDYETGTWRDLTTALKTLSFYPRTFSAPNGMAFVAGPDPWSEYLDTEGTGQWIPVDERVQPNRSYGSAVMYAPGKILYVGGGQPATNAAEVIDLNEPNPVWRAVAPMEFARRNSNATLLPNGQVLVTGGNTGESNYDGDAVMAAEIWDPVTETFTTLANMADIRWYHSTALLLPDGTVLSAGGDNHISAEVFTPPYLLEGISRPTVTSAPGTVQYGDTFFVGTPDAAEITGARWVRLGSATHAQNWDQYAQEAPITVAAGGVNVKAPVTPNASPPGYYMLFLHKGDVPSIAEMIHVGTTVPALSIDDVTVNEGTVANPGFALFTVELAVSSAKTVTATYSTAPGTAVAGVDYVVQTGTVTFAPGTTTQTIAIPLLNNGVAVDNKTFTLTLATPTNAGFTDPTATATIRDVSSLPAIEIEDTSIVEADAGTTNATFVVTLSKPSTTPVTVTYTTADDTAKAGADYVAKTGTITFSPGITQQTVTVAVIGDTKDEFNNSFLLKLSAPQGATLGTTEAQCVIVSNDPPPQAHLPVAITVAEPAVGATTTVTVTATLSVPSGKPVELPWEVRADSALPGINYVDQVGLVIFPPGVTTQTFTINILNDGVKTPNRQFTIYEQAEVVNANYGVRTTLVTITDNNALPGISLSNATVTEGNAGTAAAVFTATLSAPVSQPVTVTYTTSAGTATAGSDFVQTAGTITFPANSTTQTISVLVNGDALAESNETFNVTLTNPVNAILTGPKAVGTIVNDDGGAVPAIPTKFAAVAGAGAAGLSWNAVAGASSYRIYRGTTPNGEGTTPIAVGVTGTTFVDTGLTNGTTYYYRVTAVNGTLEGTRSAQATVIPSAYRFTPNFLFNPAALTLNGYNFQNLRYSKNSLQLTDGGTNQKDSAFTSVPVNVTNFTTQFRFEQLAALGYDLPLADGFTFTIQGMGPTALGDAGGGLGYVGITNSVAIKFDLFDNAGEGNNSTGLYVNSADLTLGGVDLTGTGIDLHSGHPFDVTMSYDGTTLTVTITDSVTLATATQTYTVNIPLAVGGNTAYVGFTAGTGGFTAVQRIKSWTFSPAPTAPTTLAVTSTTATQVNLGWVNTDPNASNVLIERKTGAAGTYAQIGTALPTATTFTDTTVVPGTTYVYRIRSTTLGANSAYSGEVTATVPSTLSADLAITVTDGQTAVVPGNVVTYTIVARNNGPSAVTGATIADAFPATLTGVTYTATATGGATGFTAAGTGNIVNTVNLPAGSTITYVAQGTLSAAATGTLVNTATITAPANVTETAPANNTATDTNIITTVPVINFPNGFAGSAAQFNFNGASAAIVGPALRLTSGATQAASIYAKTKVDITNFNTQFTIQQLPGTATKADGMTFVLQNVAATAVGAAGGGLGYNGITNSVAIVFDLFSNLGEGNNSTGIAINGVRSSVINLTGTGINLQSSNALNVAVTYNGTTLTVTITDSVTLATATQNYTVNIPALLGATTGWAGFTGGTGGLTAVQNVLKWTFSPTTPVTVTAPTGLQSTAATAATVSLSWTNTAANATSVLIERKTGAAGTYAQIGATASGAINTFVDNTVAPNITYVYRVRATNGTINSTYSNEVTVATPALVADLRITNTDGQTAVAQGALVTYTIVVTNAGPAAVTGATVTDTLPATLSGATYTAVATGGATGFTAAGTGHIANTVNMPSGSTITYTVTATLSATATGTLSNTATVTAPGSVADSNPANNSATDTSTITVVSTPAINFPTTFTGAAAQFSFNGTPAAIAAGKLLLTNGGTGQATSAYYRTAVNVASFNTQFNFQINGGTATKADGMTFVLQNTGLTAVGAAGGGLGYNGIGNSIAVKFDLFNSTGEGNNSTGLLINGVPGASINLTGTGIDLHSGNIFNATLSYNGTTLTVTIRDTVTGATATQNYTVNIPAVIGSTTAYAGFTGGTGGLTAVQNLLNWTYTVTAGAAPAAARMASASTPTETTTAKSGTTALSGAALTTALLQVTDQVRGITSLATSLMGPAALSAVSASGPAGPASPSAPASGSSMRATLARPLTATLLQTSGQIKSLKLQSAGTPTVGPQFPSAGESFDPFD